jgi:sec-independent protein translocase protein TatA
MGLDNPLHIAFLVIILLLVFGARRLPEIGRSLGSGMREFKDSISGEDKSHQQAQPTQPALTQAAPQQAPPPVPSQQAAEAFGTPAPEAAPVEPTRRP